MKGDTESYLLQCFRAACADGVSAWPTPPATIEWADFLSAAKRHGLLNHLHGLVRNEAGPPEHVLAAAAEQHQQAERLDHKALYTLQLVGTALQDEAIPYVVLKGPALTRTAYAGHALRSYGDVDVLVRRRDRDRALRAIEPRWFAQRAGPLSKWVVRRIHFHALLWPCFDGCLPLELHWSLIDRANLYRIDDDGVFDRRQILRDGDTSIPALSPEDEYIYLCIHAAKHGAFNQMAMEQGAPAEWFCDVDSGNRLRWFMDLERFLKATATSLNWDVVRQRVDAWNTRDEVIAGLRVLERLLPDSQAAHALEQLGARAPNDSHVAATGRHRVMGDPVRRFLRARGMKMHKGVTVRPVRLWTAARVMFPSPTELQRYHGANAAWQLPFLYVAHPFHIVRKQFS